MENSSQHQVSYADRAIVLLVDDQPIVAEAVRRMLIDEDFLEFHYCRDPAEAIEVALRINATVILQDLIMDDIDGYVMIRFYRSNPNTSTIPIMMMSTNEDPRAKREAFENGADDYLVKLPDKIELIARIRHHTRSFYIQKERDFMFEELSNSLDALIRSQEQTKEANQKTEAAIREKVLIENVNKIKDNFLARMSHELRTPLNAILGYCELLMENAEDDARMDDHSDLNKINIAGRQLLIIINNILDISKIESGHMALDINPFDLDQLVKKIVSDAEKVADRNHNNISYSNSQKVCKVLGDESRIKQIVSNIVDNACKFTENGEITVEISHEYIDKEEYIDIYVIDTGIGMLPDQITQIFDEFSQVDSSSTRKYDGTGLGLSICQKLVHIMEGDIMVESEEGKGSKFIIRFPKEIKLEYS